jgi:hypothetical protein
MAQPAASTVPPSAPEGAQSRFLRYQGKTIAHFALRRSVGFLWGGLWEARVDAAGLCAAGPGGDGEEH